MSNTTENQNPPSDNFHSEGRSDYVLNVFIGNFRSSSSDSQILEKNLEIIFEICSKGSVWHDSLGEKGLCRELNFMLDDLLLNPLPHSINLILILKGICNLCRHNDSKESTSKFNQTLFGTLGAC